MGKWLSGSLSGILLLDKPLGITSNAALQQVKRLLCLKKAGHTGSLDPLATGMLPICIDKATKISPYLLNADKQYEVCARLGICTNTGDAEGTIIARNPIRPYKVAEIESVLKAFWGEIEQIPPMFSAIKQNGTPLYELARRNITVERAKRTISIHQLKLLKIETDQISLFVHCSKGTYIRTLIEDIGQALGCGAYVSKLRRTAVGKYLPFQMISLNQIEQVARSYDETRLRSFILPISSSLEHLPNVIVNLQLLFYLERGQPIRISGAPQGGLVKLSTPNAELIGVGEILEDGRVAPRRLFRKNTL